jgi:hypothetical protein
MDGRENETASQTLQKESFECIFEKQGDSPGSSSTSSSSSSENGRTRITKQAKVISNSRKRKLGEIAAAISTFTPGTHSNNNRSSNNNLVTQQSSVIGTSDDRDSSGGNATNSLEGGSTENSGHDSGTNSNSSAARGDSATHHPAPDFSHSRFHRHHRHYLPSRPLEYLKGSFDSTHSRDNLDDGSALHVLGDDGSQRIAATKPATVVASRYDTIASSSGGSGGEACNQHVLPRHREPGYHTIRRTFNRFPSPSRKEKIKSMRRAHTESSSSSMEETASFTKKKVAKSDTKDAANEKRSLKVRKHQSSPSSGAHESERNGGGSSSGSGTEGTEGGYAGSASSNETGRPQASCSSPSVSSEESRTRGRHNSKRLNTQSSDDMSSSSEIADFSSGSSETADDDGVRVEDFESFGSSPSPPLSSTNGDVSDDLEESYLSAKRAADAEHERMLQSITKKRKIAPGKEDSVEETKIASKPPAIVHSSKRLTVRNVNGKPPILAVSSDIMAHVLTFLQPPEILEVLTMPLSKSWRQSFTRQPELWRILCLVEPFKANVEQNISSSEEDSSSNDDTASSSEDSFCSIKGSSKDEKNSLDKFRGLYTSFVRCMKYLFQIRDDAVSGRPPAYIDYGYPGAARIAVRTGRETAVSPPPPSVTGTNKSLQLFLAEARGVVAKSSEQNVNNDLKSRLNTSPRVASISKKARDAQQAQLENISDYSAVISNTVLTTTNKLKKIQRKPFRKGKDKKGPRFGPSMITGRLLGPAGGEAGNMNLPWSCAIYSIVNWMTAYSEVEGIQTLCLKVLPSILEDEQQRLTAQTARLTDVVLRAMVMFPNSEQLHIAAFHTIVLLARPHGGREGMLFHSSMTAAGIFGVNSQHGKSGIAVMLDSMMRFQDSPVLLAMSCWALVNIALAPEQKAALVKLGGIQATTNAMMRHPFSAEVQFRALFALINLVIPSVKMETRDNNATANAHFVEAPAAVPDPVARASAAAAMEEDLAETIEVTERATIDELIGGIASLVVRAMKNFCSSEAILNRACLVLHNLSLTDEYHGTLLWTPQCYQMLDWCIQNYRTDQVLQQSATGTLHRLQLTLSQNENMRARFTESLRTQQQLAMEQAQNEARRLNAQQESLLVSAREAANAETR